MNKQRGVLIVSFGGPRSLGEVQEFLVELLTDQEVIRTSWPSWLHRLVFTYVAKKRSGKVSVDYEEIGGGSPIFEDTECLARSVGAHLGQEVRVFHRYLPQTHSSFVEQINRWKDIEQIDVFPLFPQFSYATTGSIALWFKTHLSPQIVKKMRWVRAYGTDPFYIQAMQKTLSDYLSEQGIAQQDALLLFSAHGLPQRFIDTGDPYQQECEQGAALIAAAFPQALTLLSYQSQFGKEPWIQPYTSAVCSQITKYTQGRKKVVVIPLSFTSDHIETLYEVEKTYLPVIRDLGLEAYRCPALNQNPDWIRGVAQRISSPDSPLLTPLEALLRC